MMGWMRRPFVLASLVLYVLLAIGSVAGLLRAPDTQVAQAAASPVGSVLQPAVCFADLAGGLTVTGIAVAAAAIDYPGVRGGRRLGLFAGWLGLSLAEALQKDLLPVPGPTGALQGPNAGWCRAMEAVADGPVLGLGGAILVGIEHLAHLPVSRHVPSLPYTFPSGHAARSSYVLGLLAAGFWGNGWLGWAVAAIGAVAEAWILVAAHWHWASDVLAGWLLAGVTLAVVLPRRRRG
jgi:membrane-associated phospholipid phosphatase